MRVGTVLLAIFLPVLSAQLGSRGTGGREQEILRQLDEFKALGYKDYQEKVVEMAKSFNRYLAFQKKVCSGEFSPLVFQGAGEGKESQEEGQSAPQKPSPEEREACLRSLREVQKKYIEVSFHKREEFLQAAHVARMEQLQQQRQQALQQIEPPPVKGKRRRR